MPISPRLSRAVGHYDPNNESEFRGDVDRSIKSLENQIALLRGARSNEFAKASLRQHWLVDSDGVKEYPVSQSLFSASVVIESGTSSLTSGEANFVYEPISTGWTANSASDWAEGSPADGEFKYTGAEARNFLILWNLNLGWRTSGTYAQRTAIAGKVEKDDGGGFSIVPGSFQVSASRMQYLTYLGSYFFQGGVSGGAISSVEPDDLISFRWGYHNKNTAGGSYTAVLQATTPDSGATINIVPVGE